jgi:hypothetical protein
MHGILLQYILAYHDGDVKWKMAGKGRSACRSRTGDAAAPDHLTETELHRQRQTARIDTASFCVLQPG